MSQTHEEAAASIKFSKFTVETDGTAKGTKILLNGKEIDNLNYMSFSFWPGEDGSPYVSFSTRDPKREAGTLAETSYYSLVPPSSSASKAEASQGGTFAKQDTVPAEALKGAERKNLYAKL